MSTPSPQTIIYAYRNLYRGLLHAVQYSKPARYVARDQLRKAFRREHPSSYNQAKVDKTVEFLRLAAKETGLEHRLVRNLLHTAYWEKHHFTKYASDEHGSMHSLIVLQTQVRTYYSSKTYQGDFEDPLSDDSSNAQRQYGSLPAVKSGVWHCHCFHCVLLLSGVSSTMELGVQNYYEWKRFSSSFWGGRPASIPCPGWSPALAEWYTKTPKKVCMPKLVFFK